MPTDDKREFRLRPRKPRTGRSGEASGWPVAFKAVMRYTRMHRRAMAHKRGVRHGSPVIDSISAVRSASPIPAIE